MAKFAYINPNVCDRSPLSCPVGTMTQEGEVPEVDQDKCKGHYKFFNHYPRNAVSLKRINKI